MYYYNGNPLPLNKAFTDTDGNQYPANWLRTSSQEQRDALGITWVQPDPAAYYDQRFYWGVGNPKDLDELKELWIANQKKTAETLLAPTDWYAARAHDNGAPTPEAVTVYRGQVRTISNQREAQINATVDVDELAALITAPATTPAANEDDPQVVEQQPNPTALVPWPELDGGNF